MSLTGATNSQSACLSHSDLLLDATVYGQVRDFVIAAARRRIRESIGRNEVAPTQFGGIGWDSIQRLSQIVDEDVMVWSNRGPGATGTAGGTNEFGRWVRYGSQAWSGD